ncbi:MAG: PilN domain-containing protein [Candidatus Omnitrophica bacterium]|nr:PilN domain-containing protein [Candidatus Omnitrophota bacterium]
MKEIIEINILKKRLEKYIKKILFLRVLIFYFSGLLIVLFVCYVISFSNKIIIERTKREIADLEKKIMLEKTIFKNLKESDEKLKILCLKCSFYKDEYQNKLTWSEILTIISESLPNGMWINKLSYKKEYSKGGKDFIIIIEGFISPYFIKPEKGCSIFVKNLKQRGNNFFENIMLSEIVKGKKEDNDVYYFKFEIKFRK